MSDIMRVGTLPTQEARTDELRLICLLGRNGAGKDSKVEKAMKTYGEYFEVMTMSNLLVEAQKNDPVFKAEAEKIMAEGGLISDEKVMKVLFEALEAKRGSGKVLILNGYPRTEIQAVKLLEWAEANNAVVERSIYVTLDIEIIVKRLADRRVCPNRCKSSPYTLSDYHPPKISGICDDCGAALIQRKDDKPETVLKRICEYDTNEPGIYHQWVDAGVKVSVVNNEDGKTAQARFNAILAEIAEI